MNIHVTDKPFEGLVALRADYAAVRRRLFNPSSAVRTIVQAAPVDSVATARRRPPAQKLHFHDSHVFAYRRWQMAAANGPCTAHILARCEEAGMSYEVVCGPCRKRSVTHFRQMLMWEIKMNVNPTISYPELSKLFGGRDHTTALHGIRAHAERMKTNT